MARTYNFIYNKLVEDQNDVVGHIAYSLYKAEKVEFIESFKKDHGNNEPTESDLEPFHRSTCLKGSIERYRLTASNILGATLNNVLEETIQDLEKQCRDDHKQMITEVVSSLKPISEEERKKILETTVVEKLKPLNYWKQFGFGTAQSVAGAFAFAIILAITGFINLFKLSDITVSYKGNNDNQKQTENVMSPSLTQDTTYIPNISKPAK